MVYQAQLWAKGESLKVVPRKATIESILKNMDPGVTVICIDIENWSLKGDGPEASRNLEKYIEVLNILWTFCLN